MQISLQKILPKVGAMPTKLKMLPKGIWRHINQKTLNLKKHPGSPFGNWTIAVILVNGLRRWPNIILYYIILKHWVDVSWKNPLDTQRYCDLESTSFTLIQCRNKHEKVVCPVGILWLSRMLPPSDWYLLAVAKPHLVNPIPVNVGQIHWKDVQRL